MDCGDNAAVKTPQIIESIIDETYSNYAMLNFIVVYLNAPEFEIECISFIRRVSEWNNIMEKNDNRVMIPPCKAIVKVPEVNLTAYYILTFYSRFNPSQHLKGTTIITSPKHLLILKVPLIPRLHSAVTAPIDYVEDLESQKDSNEKLYIKNRSHKRELIKQVLCVTECRQASMNTRCVGIATDRLQDTKGSNSVGISTDLKQDLKYTCSVGISTDLNQRFIDTSSLGIGNVLKDDSASIGISTELRKESIHPTSIGISTDLRQPILTYSVGIMNVLRNDSTSVAISTDKQTSIHKTSVGVSTEPTQDSILSVVKLPYLFYYSLWKATFCENPTKIKSIYNLNYFEDMLIIGPALDYLKACVEPLNSSIFVKTVLKDLGKSFLNILTPCPI